MTLYKISETELVPAPETLMDSEESMLLLKCYLPQKRTVYFRKYCIINGHSHFKMRLPFPYLLFIRFPNKEFRVLMTLEPPTLDSKIYIPSLGNINLICSYKGERVFTADSSVCMTFMTLDMPHLSYIFSNMIEYFWSSAFNYSGNFTHYLSYPKWQDIEMNDVLNPEHWIQYCDYSTKLKERDFLWWRRLRLESETIEKFHCLDEIKTLRDFLELWEQYVV